VPAGGISCNGPYVAGIYSIGMVDDELRLTERVYSYADGVSQFPECVAPRAVWFITVDPPASRKRLAAICKRSLPQRVCTARLSRQLHGCAVRPTFTESRARRFNGDRRTCRRASVPDWSSVRIVSASELLDTSFRPE
jgi:hypothetical protein